MKMLGKYALLCCLSILAPTAHAEKATILLQEDAPLEITNYTNRYKSPDRVGDGTVIHRANVKNTSNQPIEAYGLGFYIFDAFNRDMGRPFVGYAMDRVVVDASDDPGWEQRPGSAFLFRRHGHGLAYVAIVRFEDGTIWRADDSSITKQLEDFELLLDGESGE
ncbi:hypothetical protein TRL7639_03878 [Falsiruegeria litorea R37]|uniref:Uncharacterized protein n=1 Tax=Falsiruegeria litorea R37 TaxID=1200284 RepID=A0A1Y5TMC6_9RHOB|nr:hypothetical protein [Falsiruegeria litorea]SLN67370.1 hypothetical protein TRL7639_03878 [Falsiruegeria litorea R37]